MCNRGKKAPKEKQRNFTIYSPVLSRFLLRLQFEQTNKQLEEKKDREK